MPPSPAELFERHHLVVYRYLLRLTGSREDAEDLTQEAFLRAVKALDRYRETQHERAWLFRIVRNLLSDRQRERLRRPPTSALEYAQPSCAPEQPLRLSLLEALTALPESDRESFLLSELGGLTYQEVASVCDTTVAAVRSRVYRARMALRASLDRERAHQPILARGPHEREL